MTIIVIMLIYVASLEFQLPACIVIHNHCLNTTLTAPVYYGYGAVCSELSDRQIDIDTKMRISFKIDTIENNFDCALLFKLKKHVESDDQHIIETSTTETDENKTRHVYMLVIWGMKDANAFIYVVLVEHTKGFNWNEDELRRLYYENYDRLKKYDGVTPDTWMIDNNVLLKTKFKLKGSKRNPKLSISISEGRKNDHAIRPFCINLER
jgi:hypothetical protein